MWQFSPSYALCAAKKTHFFIFIFIMFLLPCRAVGDKATTNISPNLDRIFQVYSLNNAHCDPSFK
jgi:hypothetical protein